MKINDIRIRELVWCWFTSHAPYCSAVSNFSKRVVTGGRRQGLPLMNGNGLGPTTKLLCDPETRPDPTQRASCSTLTILIKTRSAMLMPSSCPWQCCVNSLARTWTFAHLYNVIRHQQECRRRGQSYSDMVASVTGLEICQGWRWGDCPLGWHTDIWYLANTALVLLDESWVEKISAQHSGTGSDRELCCYRCVEVSWSESDDSLWSRVPCVRGPGAGSGLSWRLSVSPPPRPGGQL